MQERRSKMGGTDTEAEFGMQIEQTPHCALLFYMLQQLVAYKF